MLSKENLYSEVIRAIEVLGKGEQFTIFQYISRTEFDIIIRMVINKIMADCECCKLRKYEVK